MGCGGSSAIHRSVQPELAKARSVSYAKATDSSSADERNNREKGKGNGKGKSGGKGRGKFNPKSKFQITLSGEWKDYDDVEDMALKRAFLVGQPNVRFTLRGQQYEYNFKDMKQINEGSGKSRDIRPPHRMKPPAAPLLPLGPMVVITVRQESPGTTITISDPNNVGQEIRVRVPENSKNGQKMVVPVPELGETVEQLHHKQQEWSTGTKVAPGGGAAAGSLVISGVVLGDHLTKETAAAGEGAENAQADVSDSTAGAVSSACARNGHAVDDAGEPLAGARDDIREWLGDAAEDEGDFVMNLF